MASETAIPIVYHRMIESIGSMTATPDTMLHIHAGMAVLLIARLVTRQPLASPLPFLIVCLAEAANEGLDYLYYGSWRWHDTSMDILCTLFWPATLMLGLRFNGWLQRTRDLKLVQAEI